MQKSILLLLAAALLTTISCGKQIKDSSLTRNPAASQQGNDDMESLSATTGNMAYMTFNQSSEATIPEEVKLVSGQVTQEVIRLYFDYISEEDFAYFCEYSYKADKQMFSFKRCFSDVEGNRPYEVYAGYEEVIHSGKSLSLEILNAGDNNIKVNTVIEVRQLQL